MPWTDYPYIDEPNPGATALTGAHLKAEAARLAIYAEAYADSVAGGGGGGTIPPAVVQWTAASSAPTGWLVANGSDVSRTTYAALFAAVGITYGAGNGSTTFTLPDLRDRAAVGSGSSHALGAAGGAATVTLSAAQMPSHSHAGPSHSHSIPAHTHQLDLTIGSVTGGGIAIFQVQQPNTGTVYDTRSSGASTSGSAGTGATGTTGSGGSHENLPPYLALLPIIKT